MVLMPAGCGCPRRVSFSSYQMLWLPACLHGIKPGQLLGNSSSTENIIQEGGTAEPRVGMARWRVNDAGHPDRRQL